MNAGVKLETTNLPIRKRQGHDQDDPISLTKRRKPKR